MISNKQIDKIKLAITTACNLSCDYCFVNQAEKFMGLIVAKKAVNFLINSPGEEKLLSIYGGEPFLNFPLILKIIPYAQRLVKKKRKKLIVNICTNGTLLNLEHLLFIKKHKIRLIISLVGQRTVQNKFRMLKGGGGSYDLIMQKLPLIFRIVPKDNLGISFCLFPSTINSLMENFRFILSLDFNYLNFEIIRDYENWSLGAQRGFQKKFKKILKSVIEGISKGQFIFINPISWQLKYRAEKKDSLLNNCLFLRDLEFYPNGEVAFSPFVLNYKNKRKYIVGNLSEDFLKKKFTACVFSNNQRCRLCRHNYFLGYRSDAEADNVFKIYRRLCLEAVKEIEFRAKKERNFRVYLNKARGVKCF